MSLQEKLEKFHIAIEYCDLPRIQEYLNDSDRVELLTTPCNGMYPLHRAAYSLNPKTIQYLGMEGCDPRQRTADANGYTPLMVWAERMHKMHLSSKQKLNKEQNEFYKNALQTLDVFYNIGSFIHDRTPIGRTIQNVHPFMPSEWVEHWVKKGGWEWMCIDDSAFSTSIDVNPGVLYKEYLEDLEIDQDQMAMAFREWGKRENHLNLKTSKSGLLIKAGNRFTDDDFDEIPF